MQVHNAWHACVLSKSGIRITFDYLWCCPRSAKPPRHFIHAIQKTSTNPSFQRSTVTQLHRCSNAVILSILNQTLSVIYFLSFPYVHYVSLSRIRMPLFSVSIAYTTVIWKEKYSRKGVSHWSCKWPYPCSFVIWPLEDGLVTIIEQILIVQSFYLKVQE